jgi:hypothetical protein
MVLAGPAALAWLTMAPSFLGGAGDAALILCMAPRATVVDRSIDSMAIVLNGISPRTLVEASILMLAAMVLPLSIPHAAWLAKRVFPGWRLPLVLVFALAVSAVWLPMLIAITWFGMVVPAGLAAIIPAPIVGLLVAATAALHRMSGEARAALAQCHRQAPFRPFWPACVRDAASLGVVAGLRCMRFCAPCMLLPWFASFPGIAMVGVTGLAVIDRFNFRPNASRSGLVVCLFAGAELMQALALAGT